MEAPVKPRCLILGGGGHGRVVIDALLAAGAARELAVVDRRNDGDVLGVPFAGTDADLPALRAAGFTHFVVGLGGIGDNRPREALYHRGLAAALTPMVVIHPAAVVSPFSQVGAGAVILAGAIINAGAALGANIVVNTGAIVEHDCRVGDHVQLSPGCRLLGGVTVGRLAYVGAGAVVLQNRTVGEEALIGAQAVVVEDVPAGSRCLGVPGVSRSRPGSGLN